MEEDEQMKAKLYELLESLGYGAYEQGSFTTTEEYPEHFFTVWNIDTPIDRYYNNTPSRSVWEFAISFYSVDPLLTESVLESARELLRKNGWIIPTRGKDVASDSMRHSGRELNAYFIEKM